MARSAPHGSSQSFLETAFGTNAQKAALASRALTDPYLDRSISSHGTCRRPSRLVLSDRPGVAFAESTCSFFDIVRPFFEKFSSRKKEGKLLHSYYEPDVVDLIRNKAYQSYGYGQYPTAMLFDKVA